MGSIEAFPGSHNAAKRQRVVSAWRRAPVPGSGVVRVRSARLEDYAAIRALQREAHAGIPEGSLKQFESHRNAFPDGQLVAAIDGVVVGAASCLVLRWENYELRPTWKRVTGDGLFTTHDTAGRTLFCADLVLDLARRGSGIGRALFQAQRRLCRKLNLRRIIASARLPGYRQVRSTMPPELYAQRVIRGDIHDAHLRLPLSQGFQYCGIVEDYLPEDRDSCGHAALLVWLNPLFSPAGPPANVETERPRKCA